MHMLVQAGAEAVNEDHCADLQGSLVHTQSTGAVSLQALRDDTQKDSQHHVQYRPITLHEIAQPLWHRQHPLAHRLARENVITQVRGSLYHAPRVARGADPTAFAGEGHEVVVPAVTTAGAGKAVGADATFEVFAKRLSDVGLGFGARLRARV
jgi:hypothetical protein